jgi:hypothetical protein
VKHTPGPWVTVRCDNGERCIRQERESNPLAAIAWTNVPSPEGNERRIEANAKLIAAAPDLLAALQYIGCIGGTTCCPETPCRVCGAINKSEGK